MQPLRRLSMIVLFCALCAPVLAQDAALDAALDRYDAGEFDAALKVIEPAARGGNPSAQFILGTAFWLGQGREKDTRLAQDWLMKSADQKDPRAVYALAELLLKNNEIEPALQRLQDGMALAYPQSFYRRATLMQQGIGGAADPAGAAALFAVALDLGLPDAGFDLAEIYRTGLGVPVDLERVRVVLSQTAAYGIPRAMGQLGLMHEVGEGGPADPAAAFALYQEAVNLGDPDAAVLLAQFMQSRDGYWTNPPLALAYCLWGAKVSESEAQGAICDALANDMTPEDKTAGEAMATEF